MICHRRAPRFAALALIVALPLLAQSPAASARPTKASPKVCARHPQRPVCAQGAGGSSTAGAPPPRSPSRSTPTRWSRRASPRSTP